MMDLMKRLSKAKTSLILEHPFFGTIAMNMPFSLNEDMPEPKTARTNGKRIEFHPGFIDSLTDEELVFLVAHECGHPMLEHIFRRFERDPNKWNKANDYILNELLVNDNIGKMPSDGLQDTNIYNAGGGTSDGVYKLMPDSEDGDDNGTGNGWQDCEDAPGTQADKDQAAAEMKVTVAQAAQAAKMMGKLSASQAILVDQLLNPKVDWREVLQQFVEKCKNDSRTWSRPNRRFLSQGMYVPSISGEAMGELVFAVDCSGSCVADIPQFASEVYTVHEDHKPKRLHIIYFDSEVCHYDSFTRDDECHIEPHGGGGTQFSPIFRYIEEHDITPVATVILTDLCCNDFGPAPAYPVLWVSNHSEKAEFGEVVMI